MPTSRILAPVDSSRAGRRKPSPISISSPRLITISRPAASTVAASTSAAALLFTTCTAPAAGTALASAASAPLPRRPLVPAARSNSRSVQPAAASTASLAAADSGARPRLVCSSTPGGVDHRGQRGRPGGQRGHRRVGHRRGGDARRTGPAPAPAAPPPAPARGRGAAAAAASRGSASTASVRGTSRRASTRATIPARSPARRGRPVPPPARLRGGTSRRGFRDALHRAALAGYPAYASLNPPLTKDVRSYGWENADSAVPRGHERAAADPAGHMGCPDSLRRPVLSLRVHAGQGLDLHHRQAVAGDPAGHRRGPGRVYRAGERAAAAGHPRRLRGGARRRLVRGRQPAQRVVESRAPPRRGSRSAGTSPGWPSRSLASSSGWA